MDPEKQGLLGSESKTEYRSIDPRKVLIQQFFIKCVQNLTFAKCLFIYIIDYFQFLCYFWAPPSPLHPKMNMHFLLW